MPLLVLLLKVRVLSSFTCAYYDSVSGRMRVIDIVAISLDSEALLVEFYSVFSLQDSA
jgi:hypothetical protein